MFNGFLQLIRCGIQLYEVRRNIADQVQVKAVSDQRARVSVFFNIRIFKEFPDSGGKLISAVALKCV